MTTPDSPAKRRKPRGLLARGGAFWVASTAEFEFSTAETALLEEARRCIDRHDALAEAIASLGPMVAGSTGQPVVNPALTEARGQQVVLHRLIGALQLPDDQGQAVPTGRTASASTAAKARWKPKAS